MMPKLLFLWFAAAVFVLGEGRDRLLPASNESLLVANATFKNDSEPDVQELPNRISIVATEKPVLTASPKAVEPIRLRLKSEEMAGGNTTTAAAVTTTAQSIPLSRNPATATIQIPTSESSTAAATEDASPVPIQRIVTHVPLSSASLVSLGPGKWVVNMTNRVCIVVQMAVMLNVSYTDVDNKTSSRTFEIPADNTTRVSGFCGESEQNLTLEWPTATNDSTAFANLTIHFVKNETEKSYSLHHLDVSLPVNSFPNSTLNQTMVLVYVSPSDYAVPLSESYRCLKQQTLWLKRIVDDHRINEDLNDSRNSSGYVTVSDLQFQAFRADNSTVFGLAKDCAYDTPDVVPIAVGCVLAALVVIVLFAYLIGRRHQAHGYLSM